MSHKCLPVPVAPWNVGNGARELLNYGKGNVERETPWGRRVFVAVMGGGFTPGWAGLGQMDLKWCHQNQTWEREYGTRRTSGKRRFGRGVGIKWEQPTGNASCRVSYIDFMCRCHPCHCSSSSPPAPKQWLHCIHLQQLSGLGNFFCLGTRVWFILHRNVVHKCAVLNQTFLNFLSPIASEM